MRLTKLIRDRFHRTAHSTPCIDLPDPDQSPILCSDWLHGGKVRGLCLQREASVVELTPLARDIL